MQPAGLVTLTMRELDRLKVIQAVVDMGLKLLPPVTVAIENCGQVAYRRSRPGLPTIVRIDRKALLRVNLGRNFPRSVEVKFPTLFGR